MVGIAIVGIIALLIYNLKKLEARRQQGAPITIGEDGQDPFQKENMGVPIFNGNLAILPTIREGGHSERENGEDEIISVAKLGKENKAGEISAGAKLEKREQRE